MAGDGTVEWGGDRPTTLLDRVFGTAWTGGARGLSAPAVATGVVSLALFAVAETLPWMTVRTTADGQPPGVPSGSSQDLPVDAVGIGFAVAYYLGLLLLLTLVAVAAVSRPHTRRVAGAAGCGLAAAMLVLAFGAVARTGEGGRYGGFEEAPTSVGTAPFFAIAALVAAVAAFVLSGWHPALPGRRRRRVEETGDPDDPEEEPGPIDLTVTPA